MNDDSSPLHKTLSEACKGFDIETRELLKALTHDDLASIKEGELTADDLREIARDIADSKNDFDNSDRQIAETIPTNIT